ncbi:sensor histidine kinase [Microtetraspora malaysiensis]|uniref:histidine kinase n=1 Tax=Microtetraspora malaysiensis TaxID=161358 RepID=A0ABW6T034_9ACTN|nr:histidine kinase [Microtetraspora malaysiensis]
MHRLIILLAVVLAALGTVAMLGAEFAGPKIPLLFMGYAAGAAAVTAGLWARTRWPDSPVGSLLAWSGVMWLASGAGYANVPAAMALGAAAPALQHGLLGHAMVVLPHGRAGTPIRRGVVALGYAVPLLSGAMSMAYGEPSGGECLCLAQAFGLVTGGRPLALVGMTMAGGYAVALSAAVYLRWVRLPRPERDTAVMFSGLTLMLLVLVYETGNLARAGGLAVHFTGGLPDSLVVLGFIVWPLAYRVALGRREAARRMAELLDAGDEARRRIERDLHDGAQQRLVNVRLLLGLARDEPARLGQAVAELGRALEELRELARGTFPAVLAEAGLGPALGSLAERAALPVQVRAALPVRPAPLVERTAYFVAAEALANASRHARPATVKIAAVLGKGLLTVEVTDDGCGGAVFGGGLRGLADRVVACGGTLSVHSPPGAGTTVRAVLPAQVSEYGQNPPVVGGRVR